MSESSFLIHIGYPKTASSWLQADIFLNEATGFCVPWKNQHGLCHQASDLFVLCDTFDQNAATEFFQPGIAIADQQNLTPVLSNEFLSGCFFFTPPNYRPSLPKEIAARLKSTFPQAKVLIVIREQKSMLISAYRQMLLMGNSLTIEEFINTGKNGKDITKHPSIGNLDNLRFDELIADYQNLFGPENILVIPFEFLRKDQVEFFNKIYQFVGNQLQEINSNNYKNVGLKGGRLALLRNLNKTIPLSRNNRKLRQKIFSFNYKIAQLAAPIFPEQFNESIETKLKTYVEDTVGDYYQTSNQNTSKLIGIDLSQFKYPC